MYSRGWIAYYRRRLPTRSEQINEVTLEAYKEAIRTNFIHSVSLYYYFKGIDFPHRSYSHHWGVPNA